MTQLDPTEANAQLWASYLSQRWMGSSIESPAARASESAGRWIATAVAPWLGLIALPRLEPVSESNPS
jgi:hypothetical protein